MYNGTLWNKILFYFFRTLWNYALWRLIMDLTPHLTEEYQARRREFRTVLLGIQSDRNRWNQCIEWTNDRLGMAVGALFIQENFNHESKVSHKEHLFYFHFLLFRV